MQAQYIHVGCQCFRIGNAPPKPGPMSSCPPLSRFMKVRFTIIVYCKVIRRRNVCINCAPVPLDHSTPYTVKMYHTISIKGRPQHIPFTSANVASNGHIANTAGQCWLWSKPKQRFHRFESHMFSIVARQPQKKLFCTATEKWPRYRTIQRWMQ